MFATTNDILKAANHLKIWPYLATDNTASMRDFPSENAVLHDIRYTYSSNKALYDHIL